MPQKTIAIVTGASGGLGKEFVRQLKKRKQITEIWAIARNQAKLDTLKDEFGKKIRTFSIDLTNRQAIADFASTLEAEQPRIQYLVNNAGYAKFCSYQELNVESSWNLIDLNVNAVVGMTLLCIPYMKKGSHILNIASQASFQPLPYLNLYSSTKVFVRHYSRALHVELKERGISVTAVCPSWMDTGLFERAEIGAKKTIHNFIGMVPTQKVVTQALQDARKQKDMSVYGPLTKVCHVAAKLLPQKVTMQLWLKLQDL